MGDGVVAKTDSALEASAFTIVVNRERDDLGRLWLRERPRISFIVLSFNNDKYLFETLQSISAQSFRDMEIVIADDGSTDNSASIIRHFVETCPLPCLGVMWADNGGIGRNYNSALTYSQGEFIAHIGSDDINHPDRLQQEVDALLATSASMCIAGIEIIDADSNKLRDASARTDCHSLDYALATGFVHVTSPTMMYRREIVDRFGLLPKGLANEDEALAFRALCCSGILVLEAKLVRYRVHAGSIQSGARSTNLSAYVRWLASNLPFQIANKEHWKDILRATSCDDRTPSVDALLLALEMKRAVLDPLTVDHGPKLLLRLLASSDGRDILKHYAVQQVRNARNGWLQLRALLRRKFQA